MSSDPANSSPVPLFKRSTNKKPRPRRERSPLSESHDADASRSTENVDQLGSSSFEQSPMTQVAKLKAKQKSRNKLQGRLSFGAEDSDNTGDEFKVKKSALSRKLNLAAPPSTPGSPAATQLNQAAYSSQTTPGLYSQSYLSELKASTPSTPSFKSRPEANMMDVDSDINMSYDGVDDSFNVDASSSIPTEASIRATKEKRERLRLLGVTTADSPSDEFISLSLTKQDPSRRDQGPHPESRLQREDDDVGEGDDDMAQYTEAQDRIALGKKAKKDEAKKRKATMAELIDEAEEEEEDEEMKDWENSQLRRGGLSIQETEAPVDKSYKPRPIPNITTLPSLTAAMSRLSGTLSNSQAAHSVHQSSLDAVRSEKSQLDEKEGEMRDLVASAETKRSWLSELHEWMETIATFLDEKFPVLEKLEEEHLSLLAERQEMLTKRRREDDEDDICLFLYVPPPAAEADDEFGRSIPQGPHAPTREARRSSRSARFTASSTPTTAPPAKLALTSDDQLGYVTDGDLLPADLEDYALAKEKLSYRVSSLLDDVKSAEFRDPTLGLARRFAEWRDRWSDLYSGAWGGLGMVGAWEFWTRLELAEWNPLEDGRPLDSFRWYSALYDFSRPLAPSSMNTDNPQDRELGSDGDLVASMVSTAVIPLLCKFFAGGGVDPYSAKHIKRAVDLVEQIELCVDRKEAKFQTFAKAFLVPFQKAIEESHNLVVPSLDPNNPPPPFEPGAVNGRRRFLSRRIKLLTGLLAWRKAVGNVVGLDDLVRRLLIDTMLPVAYSGWDVGGQEIMSTSKGLLPKDLARQDWARQLQ